MLKLKKGGVLERTSYDDPEPHEVSEFAIHYLADLIEFDDITLRDFFLLVEKNIEIFEPIFGNWIEEYTKEALYDKKSDDDVELTYLQLQWCFSLREKDLTIFHCPNFNGYGIATEENEYYKLGDEVKWGLEFVPVQSYVDVPLKLSKEVLIYDQSTDKEAVYNTNDYTLYQVVSGIIWEISFLGSPEDREKQRQDLRDTIKRIDSGEEKLIPIEDIFEELNKQLNEQDEEL